MTFKGLTSRLSSVLSALAIFGATLTPAVAAEGDLARVRLRFITYNVWGLPAPLTVRPTRFKDIALEIPKLGADVIAFQETFTSKSKPVVELKGYPYRAFGPGKSKGKLSSGVVILSKHPIVETHTLHYGDCKGFDCVANKGAVHARISVAGFGEVDVFNTHLNAGGDPAPRLIQVRELIEFVELFSGNRPRVILGDFNASPGSGPYRNLALGLGVRDAHLDYVSERPDLPRTQWEGFSMDPSRNSNLRIAESFVGPTRIDHTWYSSPCGAPTVDQSQLVFDWKFKGKHLSDHFGVATDLTLDSCAPPS